MPTRKVNEVIRAAHSAYARHFLEVLQNRGEMQVVNRGDVIEPTERADAWRRLAAG